MSRIRWYIFGGVAAVALAGAGVGLGVTLAAVAESHSASRAIDARIDASIAAENARDSKVFAEIDADNNAAVAACENLVRDQLKAPATAQFTTGSNSVAGPEGDLQGLVHGTVDSQNGFGALVRSDWTCMVLPGSSVDAMKASITNLTQR